MWYANIIAGVAFFFWESPHRSWPGGSALYRDFSPGPGFLPLWLGIRPDDLLRFPSSSRDLRNRKDKSGKLFRPETVKCVKVLALIVAVFLLLPVLRFFRRPGPHHGGRHASDGKTRLGLLRGDGDRDGRLYPLPLRPVAHYPSAGRGDRVVDEGERKRPMDVLHNIYTGFTIALTGQNLLCCAVGVLFGQLIGVLPGIGAPTAIALLLPLTFSVNPTSAIIMFAGIYYGVAYGGTITSVLINVPGESSSVMTCVDGYQMAQKGRAGAALSIAAIGSFIAGTALHRPAHVLCPGAGQTRAPFRSGGILRPGHDGLRPAHGLRQRVALQNHHLHHRRCVDFDGRHGRGERHAPFHLRHPAAPWRDRFRRRHLRDIRSGRGLQQHRGARGRGPGQG